MPRVVRLELHIHDRAGASALYRDLMQWRTERIDSRWRTHHALAVGGGLDGGIVECDTCQAGWLPYVENMRVPPRVIQVSSDGPARLAGLPSA